MNDFTADQMVANDDWSDLSCHRPMPDVDFAKLRDYRLARIRRELKKNDCAMCVLVNPISLRYAVDFRTYALFQSHIPTTYLFVPVEGPVVIHGAYGPPPSVDDVREAHIVF
ncbi:MAG: hypothetical protein ACR2OR_15465 [Hyphomicrobiales bacterium]